MGAYAERRSCDPQMLIATDRAKSLPIDLLRDVDAKTMASALEDAFERNLPPHTPLGLRSQIDTFLGYFRKDLEKGDRMEVTYVSGVGTALIQNQETAGMDAGGEGVSGPVVEFLFQRLNLLCQPQEANSRPVFPSDRLADPDRGPEMTMMQPVAEAGAAAWAGMSQR